MRPCPLLQFRRRAQMRARRTSVTRRRMVAKTYPMMPHTTLISRVRAVGTALGKEKYNASSVMWKSTLLVINGASISAQTTSLTLSLDF